MTSARRWRGRAVVALVVAVLAFAGGIAVAVLTFNGSGTGTASTATVALTVDSSVTRSCAFVNLAPGSLGASAQPCLFAVDYTGNIPAYLSLNLLVETEAGSGPGSRPLYNPASGSGMTISVTDGASPGTFDPPTTATTCPTSAPAAATCYGLNDELVSVNASVPGQAITFTLAPTFSSTVGNLFQGARATVILTLNAVQSAANPLPSACSVGQPCPPSGSFSWS